MASHAAGLGQDLARNDQLIRTLEKITGPLAEPNVVAIPRGVHLTSLLLDPLILSATERSKRNGHRFQNRTAENDF